MPSYHSTFIDKLIIHFDHALRSLSNVNLSSQVENPANNIPESEFTDKEKQHAIGLMRIDHTGEVCAQALYQGQALVARNENLKNKLLEAATEEQDHLVWCQERINELQGRTSYLNPVWYFGSFVLGMTFAAISDRASLGFLAETENQVVRHLESHLETLPSQDEKSRRILRQMRDDELRHATNAYHEGALEFPTPVKLLMRAMSQVMTTVTYWL